MKKPIEAGLYFVKTKNYKYFNGIAEVTGESPFLKITLYDRANQILAKEYPYYNITEWSNKIIEPDEEKS